MDLHRGWLLDLYPTPTGMALWILGQDGSRRCYFDNRFRPIFYVGGPTASLRRLARSLPVRFSGLRATLTEQLDLWSRQQVPVVAVAPPTLAAFSPIVRYVRRTTPALDLFNADLLPEQVYCYARRVFPLALCEIEAEGLQVHSLHCLDDPWTTDYQLPPLRVLEIRPDCPIGNPNHGGRFSVEVKVEGNT